MNEKKYIPLSVPNFRGNELKYVTDAIEKEWVSTGGSYITEFENFILYIRMNVVNKCLRCARHML